jgi:peptidyl-prolyl cis-trans isomerase SurA
MKIVVLVVAVAVAPWAPAGAARAAQPGNPTGPDATVVARVNGDSITRAELRRMRDNPLTRRQLQLELGVEGRDPERLDRLALQKLIHLRLLIQEARQRSMTVTEKELDQAITSLRRGFDDLRSFGMWMNEQGLDERSLFGAIRDDLLADRVRTSLAEGARVGEKDVQQYYEAHQEELRRAEVRLQIIAVHDKATAEEVVATLQKGEAFSRVARKRSSGRLAARGGDMGWINLGSLEPQLRDAAATLKVGDARGPLRRGDEFLVVRLAARRPGQTMTLAHARPEIERRLLPAKRQEAVEAWLTEQQVKSKIEVLTDAAAGHARRVDR